MNTIIAAAMPFAELRQIFADVDASCARLLYACRYSVKTLMWSMGFEVEVLNMTDSTNSSSLPSVDFLNRSPLAFFKALVWYCIWCNQCQCMCHFEMLVQCVPAEAACACHKAKLLCGVICLRYPCIVPHLPMHYGDLSGTAGKSI